MQASLETLSTLERRLKVAVPIDQINTEVETRLKRLQRTAKLHGFRPGKVPMKVVAQQYGPQVRQEVLGDTVQKTFDAAVREKQLRVAGYPKIEAQPSATGVDDQFEFTATFEVFPEITLGDVSQVTIERPQLDVGAAEVDKTIEVLRKQRMDYRPADRPAANGDLVTIDFVGTLDGVPFEGGTAHDQSVALGEGKLLPDFEANVVGLSAGQSKTFEMTFPEDYHGKDVAGKRVTFEVTMKQVQEARLPDVDAEFAKQLGIADGDVDRMREDVKSNLEREVKRRIQARIKDQALKALLDTSTFDTPKSLLDMETERLMQGMAESLRARGMKEETLKDMPRDVFHPEAQRRVGIGLVLAELVKTKEIKAQPEQIRAMIVDYAQAYENPDEFVRWYYQDADRVREVEAVVLENNVVDWVITTAKVVDKPVAFDELMGSQQQ